MQKIIILSLLTANVVLACTGTHKGSAQCPDNMPKFTQQLGSQLISNWGNQVSSYSPGGSAGFTDVYVGAAYFTGNNYLPDAVLLPTVSSVTRTKPQDIYDYFTHFLADQPTMTNNPDTPQAEGSFTTLEGCGYGLISGYYNFNFGNLIDDEPTKARYTFQFQYNPDPTSVSIQVASGAQTGQTIVVNQPAGHWYIRLQNSAKLPM